jgi:phage shock protein A
MMFKRLMTMIRGFFSLFIGGLEKENPEAILAAEKENLRAQIAKYNQGLAAHAALCEQLNARIRALTAEEQDLRAKTSANLRAGNRELAGQYALRLQTVTTDLADCRQKLEQSEATYKQLIQARDTSVKAAREKLDSLKRSIDEMKISRAQAELMEMAGGMVSEIGSSGDSVSRLQEMVEEERTKAAGRARVARDSMDTSGIQMKEVEQKALADQALADFAAREGLPLEPATPATEAAPAPRAMGPVTETPQGQ